MSKRATFWFLSLFVLGLGVAVLAGGCLNANGDLDCPDCRLEMEDLSLTEYPVEAEPVKSGGDLDIDSDVDMDIDVDTDVDADSDADTEVGENCAKLLSKVECVCQEMANTYGTDFNTCVSGFSIEGMDDASCQYVLAMYPACQ